MQYNKRKETTKKIKIRKQCMVLGYEKAGTRGHKQRSPESKNFNLNPNSKR